MTEFKTPPLVSIGMPTYNGEKTIRRALDSLLVQDFKDFELIISDNASVDRTGEICQQYVANDSRVRYYRNDTNIGPIANFNRLVHLALGKYFMWAADDDFWDPSYVSCMVDALNNNPDAVLSFCYFASIEDPLLILRENWSRIVGRDRFYRLFHSCYLLPWAENRSFYIYGLMRKDILLKCNGMETSVDAQAGADIVTLFHLLYYGRFVKVNKLLFYKGYNSERPFIPGPLSQKLSKKPSYYIKWLRLWHQHYHILRVIAKKTTLKIHKRIILLIMLYISELKLYFIYFRLLLKKLFD